MIINIDPDEFCVIVEDGTFKTRKATQQEYTENQRKRLLEIKEKLLFDLAYIESQLKVL